MFTVAIGRSVWLISSQRGLSQYERTRGMMRSNASFTRAVIIFSRVASPLTPASPRPHQNSMVWIIPFFADVLLKSILFLVVSHIPSSTEVKERDEKLRYRYVVAKSIVRRWVQKPNVHTRVVRLTRKEIVFRTAREVYRVRSPIRSAKDTDALCLFHACKQM